MKSLLTITFVSIGLIVASPIVSAIQSNNLSSNKFISKGENIVNFQTSNRTGSHRIGGSNSKGKGSKYIGGKRGK